MKEWLVVDSVGIVWKKYGNIDLLDNWFEVVDGEICKDVKYKK